LFAFGSTKTSKTRHLKKTLITSIAKDLSIPTVEDYKYLGTYVDSFLSPKPAMNKLLSSIIVKHHILRPAINAGDMRFMVNSFNTFVLPSLLLIPLFLEGKSKKLHT
jgi:hypothetical protein